MQKRRESYVSIWRRRPRPPIKRNANLKHSLHRLASRICTLPPRLASYLLESFSSSGDVVLDPFCGKGTIPLQACLLGRRGIGSDISPEAVCVAGAALRAPILHRVGEYIAELATAVQRIEASCSMEAEFQAIPHDIAQFFHPATLRSLLAWRHLLLRSRTDEAAFVRGLLLGILHGKGDAFLSLRCSHSYSMSPRYVRRYVAEHRLEASYRSVGQCLLNRAKSVLQDGSPAVRGRARLADARRLPYADCSADLILTSPPYFSVHRYARDNWLRLWFLGYPDYRVVQRRLIQTAHVGRYRSEMAAALAEMSRVLKPGKLCLMLVGDVRVGSHSRDSKPVNTSALLAEEAAPLGFRCEAVLRDEIPQKYKVAGYLATEGGISTERLLILRRVRP